MQKENFLKKWFPTFVNFFDNLIGTEQVAVTNEEVSPVLSFTNLTKQQEPKVKPFFLQGLDDLEEIASFSREGCLQSLGWEKNGGTNVKHLFDEAIVPQLEQQLTTVEIPPIAQSSFAPSPMRAPVSGGVINQVNPDLTNVSSGVFTEDELGDRQFFLRGLQTMHNLENMKNLDLLALLHWEEQGQTLLEVDPDDYDLLDDLLEAADI